jgi:surfeit locus 1 family protein
MTTRLPFRFRPPWWAVVLAAAGCAGGIALGNWQSGRAAQKRADAAVELVKVGGEFIPGHAIFLDNKVYRGMPGYHIVQPFRLPDGKQVLVNRGWAPAGASRDRLPEIRTPAGKVELSGVRLQRFPQAYEPQPAALEGRIWQNVTPERFSAWSGLAIETYVIEQRSSLDDGLVRDWPRAGAGVEVHESYALQWYSLAALSLILFFVLNLKIEKRKP